MYKTSYNDNYKVELRLLPFVTYSNYFLLFMTVLPTSQSFAICHRTIFQKNIHFFFGSIVNE